MGAAAPREERAGLRPRAGVSAEKGICITRQHPPWVQRAGDRAGCPGGAAEAWGVGLRAEREQGCAWLFFPSLWPCQRHGGSDESLGTRDCRALGASGRPSGDTQGAHGIPEGPQP